MEIEIDQLRINDNQFSAAINTLNQLVAIPSVSNPASSDYSSKNLDDAAHFIIHQLKQLRFDVRSKRAGDSPYFILAERINDPTKPTVLMYGHYDVQPVDREHWDSDPFQLRDQDDRLYGRGSSDNKAGILVILTAIKTLNEAGNEPSFNLRILFEGEEEYGSNNLSTLLEEEGKNLASDLLIVMDGWNKDENTGTIENFTRGVLTMTLRVDALKRPTHSGLGCLAPDPAQALAGLIYSLQDPKAITGFLEDCLYASKKEVQLMNENSQSEEAYKTEHSIIQEGTLRGDQTHSIYHRILEEPSISVLNITCGQPDGGNSIQSYAACTIGIRLTAGQDPNKIEQAIRNHLASQKVLYNLPFILTRTGLSAKAWKTDTSMPYATRYLQAMKGSYPHTTVMPSGSTIPFLQDFQSAFPHTEIFIVGVGDPKTAAHSHNESQSKLVFRRAIDSLISFLK